jgi:hypothetical protein
MDYAISQRELTRRKKAYSTLSIGILVGLAISSALFRIPVAPAVYLLAASALALLGLFSLRFFYNLTQLKISLAEQALRRTTKNTVEEFAYAEVKRVEIKRTTNNTIRQIRMWLTDGRGICITALANFEGFWKSLAQKLRKDVGIKELNEPIDFDHPAFYACLGPIIGTLSLLAVNLLLHLSSTHINMLKLVFSGYLLVMGSYFLISKPLAAQVGSKKILADCVLGVVLICAGLGFFVAFF